MTPATAHLGPESDIPEKLYFKIGEVAQLIGVQPHVLRYWEKEVSAIRPTKSASNQRRYRRRDVEIFREIRRLLYEERYTLAGARKRLSGRGGIKSTEAPVVEPIEVVVETAEQNHEEQLALGFSQPAADERLESVRAGLRDLIRMAGEEP